MKIKFTSLATATALCTLLASPAAPARLELSYLPPDFPPTDICRAPAAEVEANDTVVVDGDGEEDDLDEWVSYLNRDIRNLSQSDADGNFDFIQQLITMRAGISPKHAGPNEYFARIDLYIDAGRLDALTRDGLVMMLAEEVDALTQSERVRLAHYFMAGIGVAADPARGEALLTEQAYAGNANALLELLRLQLAGVELVNWFEPPERTATLAFGGKIGQLNRGLCARAETIAREYVDGEFLVPNADLAFAWRKFAADQGGRDAAWRVVQHMLNAKTAKFGTDDLLHYLRLAVDDAFLVNADDVDDILRIGATDRNDSINALSRLHGHAGRRHATSAIPFFELELAVDDAGLSEEGAHLSYLREVTQLRDVPGEMWTKLADELILRIGRWKAEPEAIEALTRAVDAGDPRANVKLAQLLLREGVRTGDTTRSEALLIDAVDLHGYAPAMAELNGYYRCIAVDAPNADEADEWSERWRATTDTGLNVDTRDYLVLSATHTPEIVSLLHRRAMEGSSAELAGFLKRMEAQPHIREAAVRHWAARVGRSSKALELYALGEFERANSPLEAEATIDFVRRAYLAVGPAMALDLAVSLIEYDGRNPSIAKEVRELLTEAGSRGEGAAIRLLHRLDGEDGAQIYRQFADVIEDRGDFLALMFAVPFVDESTFDEYAARAVAEMRCGTKDVAEMADAFALHHRMDEAGHWLKVGLAIEGGHSMSRLGVALHRMEMFDTPNEVTQVPREESGLSNLRLAYFKVSEPGTDAFDRSVASNLLSGALLSDDRDVLRWALGAYTRAELGIRRTIATYIDVPATLDASANRGLTEAQYALGLHLRLAADDASDLKASTDWLKRSAKAGHTGAMVDYAEALVHGIGVPTDRKLALIWLRKADALAEPRAQNLVGLVLAMLEE